MPVASPWKALVDMCRFGRLACLEFAFHVAAFRRCCVSVSAWQWSLNIPAVGTVAPGDADLQCAHRHLRHDLQGLPNCLVEVC